jgi:hypothetical protein
MSRIARALRAAPLCLGLAFVCPLAGAQEAPDASAEAHVQRGLDLRRVGDDATALAEFKLAEHSMPIARVRAQIGLALQALGRWRDAEEVLIRVLAEESDPWTLEHREVLHQSLEAVQRHLSWLSIECNVNGAEAAVNGEAAGHLPLAKPIRVVAGNVVLDVRAEGYETVRRTIEVSPGVPARESVELVVAAPAATPPASPVLPMPLTADPGIPRRTAGWTALAGGALLLSGGVVAAVVSGVNSAQYNDDARCYYGGESRDQRCGVQRGVADATLATAIAAFAAGALATIGGVYLLSSSSGTRAKAGTPAVACLLVPGAVGCRGQF